MTDLVSDALDLSEVDRMIEQEGRKGDALIPILRGIQAAYNYLPEAALLRISETTDIRPAAISGVATFYAQFRLTPAGEHRIRVCVGTACHVKGADSVTDALKQHLDIAEDADTDASAKFTVEGVACLGCCMLAPVVKVDDITYGDQSAQHVPNTLKDFLKSEQPARRKKQQQRPWLKRQGEIRTCLCSSCIAAGADKLRAELERLAHELHLSVRLKTVGCTGISFDAPLIEVGIHGENFRYGAVQPDDLRGILLTHFQPEGFGARTAAHLSGWLDHFLTDESWATATRYGQNPRDQIHAKSYDAHQIHIATEHAGELDPLDLSEYRDKGGFEALELCLNTLTPEAVIAQVEQSGLRGRGGAGFPTGTKWGMVRKEPSEIKYLICNGDEGDPGAFMDRLILESFPFRVIEGMIIASYAAGIHQGIFYIRAEYPLAASRIRAAIEICNKVGLLGREILGSDHSLELRVVEGAGAYVCGEETALIAALEGQRGMPRFRPPFPAASGLHQKPTLINNVETLSNLSWILRNGPEKFAAIGTESSKGTKTFALAGNVKRGGLIEVPMGMTLRDIVEKIGGGVPGGKKIKAVQVGGPSGGCVPARLLDTPVDYQALQATGAIMGSGGLVVLDETDCMVDVARYFLSFTQEESCGKCTHCRVGTKRMLEILERLCAGTPAPDDLLRLEKLIDMIPQGSLCGLGKTAPNPVATTLKYFRAEYEAHLEGRCPAKRCKKLINYVITDDCIGCTRCAQYCPTEAIALTPYQVHAIDLDKCIRCNICMEVCPEKTVEVQHA